MTDYRRIFLAGGSFFFTVNLADRHLRLLTEHIDKLRGAFRETRGHHPFTIDAMVVLPDHRHTVWTLSEGDAEFATRWRLIKSAFSRSLATGERIQRAAPPKASAASGSGAIGSIPFAMTTISRDTSIIFISTRSSIGWWRGSGIGRIRPSIAW
jgi:REP element-mobilizing transposase RayT